MDYDALATALDQATETLQGGLLVHPDGTWTDASHQIPDFGSSHDGLDSSTAPYSLDGQPVTGVVAVKWSDGRTWSVKCMEDAEVLDGSGGFLRHHIDELLTAGTPILLGVSTFNLNDEEDADDPRQCWAVVWSPATR